MVLPRFFLIDTYVKPFIILDIGKLGINPNNREYLFKETSYIENLDYVMLTEFIIIENEFWEQFFIFSILSKIFFISKKIFLMCIKPCTNINYTVVNHSNSNVPPVRVFGLFYHCALTFAFCWI